MAKLCPFRVWLDSNGNALNGGLIYTYISGTSTPKSTYVDSGGITTLPNPVVLDANGCKTIYLDQDAAYRFIVKTSSGTVLETIDEITPVTAFATISGGSVDVTSPDAITSTGTLELTPSNGIVKVGQFTMPTNPPSINQVLTASSSGAGATTVWSNPSGAVVQDTQPQLGGDLDTNGFNIRFNDNTGLQDDVGNEYLTFQKTASAVNQFEITHTATGSGPTLSVAGGDTNIDMHLASKGSGNVIVDDDLDVTGTATFTGGFSLSSSNLIVTTAYGIATSNGQVLKVNDAASAVNYLQLNTAATGNGVTWSAVGSDTNVNIGLTPKGSGSIVLGANTIANTAAADSTFMIGTGAGTAAFATLDTVTGLELDHPCIPKAMAYIYLTTSPLLIWGHNIASVSHIGLDGSIRYFQVTMTNALENTDYGVIMTMNNALANSTATYAELTNTDKTTTVFKFGVNGWLSGMFITLAVYNS